MRRLALILVLALCLIPALAACGGGGAAVTAEEILPVARTLIERSVIVNTILIGDGLPTGNEAFGEYLFGDRSFENEHNIHSVEDILTMAASVYTAPIYDILYAEAITKDGKEPPDYQNRAKTDTNPSGGVLVYKERVGWYQGVVHEYLYDTMTLTAATESTATVTLTVRVCASGHAPQERELSLNLLRTEAGWRCDKLTYVAYDHSSVTNET